MRLTPKQTKRLDEISNSKAYFGEPWYGTRTDKSLVRRGLCRVYEVNGHPKIGRVAQLLTPTEEATAS